MRSVVLLRIPMSTTPKYSYNRTELQEILTPASNGDIRISQSLLGDQRPDTDPVDTRCSRLIRLAPSNASATEYLTAMPTYGNIALPKAA